MIVRTVAVLLLLSGIHPLLAEEESSPTPTPRPGLFHRMVNSVNVFHKDKTGDANKPSKKDKNGKMELALQVSPDPVKLSEGSKIEVTVILTNKSGKMVQLQFPTTQRVEVLLRNGAGKLVTQWSEEQSFSNDPGYVTIDNGERVQYTVTISGRDMAVGQPYTIEGFFPNYVNLRATKTIIPQK